MSNFGGGRPHDTWRPRPVGDGVYFNFVSPGTEFKVALDHTRRETRAKCIAAILADFDNYEGKVLCAATALHTFTELVDCMSRTSKKSVVCRQIPEETWRGFLPPTMKNYIAKMMQFFQDYGYYGMDTEEKVKWSAEQARGKLATTLDEFFRAHPLIPTGMNLSML